MKKSLLLIISLLVFSLLGLQAQTYSVTLKIVDQTKKTTISNDAPGTNVIVSVDASMAEQNPRTPSGDWWYPMYADAGVTPKGVYSENANDVTWQITFNVTPGEYAWTPYMKSLGWKFLNNAYMYSSDLDNPAINFTVKEDGSIEGVTTLTIPAIQPKYFFTVKVVDKTKGELTNDLYDAANTDKNVFAWVSGGVSQSQDWWTALYYDASYGPTSKLIKGADDWTWQATFQGSPGVYEWNPSMKSLGWKTINGNVGDAKWTGDNLKFIVAADGTVSGNNVLTVNTIRGQAQLTLNLDMKGAAIDAAGLHVIGSFNAWDLATAPALTDVDGDGIYTVTISLDKSATPYQYKFINGDAWGKEEYPVGDCAYRSNRLVTLTDASLTVDAAWGFCDMNATVKKKVACIGDSNTEGAGIGEADRPSKSWPSQLRNYLNHNYYTDNFGVSGATLMNLPDPWGAWTNNVSNCYENNKAYGANIILVALGTNDSKTAYWGTRDFKADYISLINEFATLSSNPEVYMVTPIKALSNGYDISNDNIVNGVIPAIKELSKEKMIAVIDWYAVSSSWGFSELSDGVHANEASLSLMAEKVAQILSTKKPVLAVGKTSAHTYAEYCWYLNGSLISGATSATYTTTQAGVYNLALKLTSTADDIIVSYPFTAESGVSLGIDDAGSGIDKAGNESPVNIYSGSGNLSITGAANARLSVYTISGSLIKVIDLASDVEVVNIESLSKGIYLCKVVQNGSTKLVKKVIR